MLEPRVGRVALIFAFAFASAASVGWYPATRAPTLLFPVIAGVLPFAAKDARIGEDLRWLAAILLLLWVAAGSLSVGPFYVPAAIAMFIAASKARKTPPEDAR
jgi:hypothetical protein